MQTTMKNRRTSEMRTVERYSPEYEALRREVQGTGSPMWEEVDEAGAPQGSSEYAQALERRYEKPLEDILPHAALVADARGVPPSDNPHLTLSPGELDAGLTPETKLAEIRRTYAANVPTAEELLAGDEESASSHPEETSASDTKESDSPGVKKSSRAAQAAAVAAGGDD